MAAAAIVGTLAGLVDATEVLAATFTVNSSADIPDFAPGNGVCRTTQIGLPVVGTCTLRAAIQEANALPGPDTIVLPAGTFTLSDAPGPERITDEVIIVGAGQTSTIIDLGANTVDAPDWKITNTTASIVGLTVSRGGGISSTASTFFLTSSAIDLSGKTGLEVNAGFATISSSAITRAQHGSGINSAGTLTINDSLISGNRNDDSTGLLGGAGLLNSNGGVATIGASLFTDNVSTRTNGSGAIRNLGTLVLVNSTISGNSGPQAGGINAATGQYTLVNVTIANNTGGGVRTGPNTTVSLMQNVLLANNGRRNCIGAPQLDPSPTRQQNMTDDTTCNFPAGSNFSLVDPQILPLADNGGATATHRLPAGSAAIDNAFCNGLVSITTDQRGQVRPRDGNGDGVPLCDIGAFEFGRLIGGGAGVGALTPRESTVGVNQALTQVVTWDVPGPDSWNALTTVDYRLRADGRIVFWLRWDQATNLFQPLDASGNPIGPALRVGTPVQLSFGEVTLDVGGLDGRGSGPTGRRATLTLPLQFGDGLQGKTLTAELAATSDLGGSDPFATAGTIRVGGVSAHAPTEPSANNSGHADEGRVTKDKDDRKPPSEQRQRERDRTNKLGADDDRTEGNVVEVNCAGDAPSVTIANRDGRVVVMLLGESRSACGSIRAGQYLEADGVKVHEGLFEAESVH